MRTTGKIRRYDCIKNAATKRGKIMGLSASQGRLLSLTSRMSDLELQAQTISNSKIRLSQESSQASRNYSAALDKQTMKVYSGLQSDGTSSYIDATAANLTTYGAISNTDKQRFIKTSSGQLVVSEDMANAFEWSTKGKFAPLGNKDSAHYKNLSYDQIIQDNTFIEFLSYAKEKPDLNKDGKYNMDDYNQLISNMGKSQVQYYINLFEEMIDDGCTTVGDENLNSSEWLSDQIQAGNVYLYEYDAEGGAEGTGDFVGVSWTSGDNSLQFKEDNTDLAKAEAEYEATMADIETKDKQFDLELQNINTEHTAVQAELDTVKKVISKNIDRSFKIFDA